MDTDDLILVDQNDREIGHAPKLDAHRTGRLHRAVSVFLINRRGQLLLQRRATDKYHSGGLWSNTCCGHPRPGETTSSAAHRRLREEMGIECELSPTFSFKYRAELPPDLVEHEIDHVFVGSFDGDPTPDRNEVSEWRWTGIQELVADRRANPSRYTAWLGHVLDGLLAKLGPGIGLGRLTFDPKPVG
ncbi:MAG TPA: isopentenyl-diphosphate Delta-isomerase [Gemmatimonadaceae bacterium]